MPSHSSARTGLSPDAPEPAGDAKIPVYVDLIGVPFIGLTAYVTENGDPVTPLGETNYFAVTPGKSAVGLTGGGAKPHDHWELLVIKTDGTTVSDDRIIAAFDYEIPDDAVYVELISYEVE